MLFSAAQLFNNGLYLNRFFKVIENEKSVMIFDISRPEIYHGADKASSVICKIFITYYSMAHPKKAQYYILGITILVIAIAIVMCKHEPFPVPERPVVGNNNNSGNPVYGSSGDTIKDSVCFSEEILPLIQSNCAKSGCHDAAATGDLMPLTNYNQVMQITSPYNPGGSLLYNVIRGHQTDIMPPSPNPQLTAAQIQLINNWIMEGAKQNIDCGMSCDTNTFTYSGAVNLIIQNNCRGCHSGSSPGGGISLQSYADVLVIVNNGKLWGSVNHVPGYIGMPLNSSMLSSCRLRQIKRWIDAGAQNN